MLQQVTLRQSLPNSLVGLGRIRSQRKSKRLKEHPLQNLQPKCLVLTLLLSEINDLGEDDSTSSVFGVELCVGSSLREIVLFVKSNPP
jgi:hypothetical protein